MRLGYWLLSFCVLVSAFSPATAGMYLTLSADPGGSQCMIADPGPNAIATVYVLLKYQPPGEIGAAAVSFAAPVPVNSGLSYVGESSTFYTSGNSQTGVAVELGTCVPSSPIVVTTMWFMRTSGGDPCTRYGPASPPAFLSTFLDCQFSERPIQVYPGVILNWAGTCDQVANLGPPDGASNVPLITSLQWRDPVQCNPVLRGDPFVRFGTSPDPPFFALSWSPINVGPLAPMTTYYWKVDFGPVWSFTTTDKVATQQSTWGAIKALYR